MPDFDEKTRLSPDRSTRDRHNGEVADPTPDRKTYPEAFGRSAPPRPLPEAFGRAGAQALTRPEKEHEEEQPQEKKEVEEEEQNEEPEKPPFYKRPVPMIILGVVLLIAIVAGVLWWLHARQFEKTDDAFITGHLVRVAPRVSGQALKVLVDDNQLVHKGDLLVQIDPRDFQARVDQAQADLQSTQGKVAESEAAVLATQADVGRAHAAETSASSEAERTAADLKRYEALDPRSVSQQQLDLARSTARSARAKLESAKKETVAAQAQVTSSQAQVKTNQAKVAEAQAALDQANLYLQYTRITAPEDGRVTNKNVEPGSYLQTGQALFSIVPRDIWVVANFKETQITDMRPGQPVKIKVDAYPDQDFEGHVDSFQTGTGAAFSLLPPENATGNYVKVVQRVPVKIVFDHPPDDRYLLGPGMSVTPRVKVK